MIAQYGMHTTLMQLKTRKPVTTGTSSPEQLTLPFITCAVLNSSTSYHKSQAIREYKQMLDYMVAAGMLMLPPES